MIIAALQWLNQYTGTPVHPARHRLYVHPCVIDNRPHIVYPRGLQTEAPQLFQYLHNFYRRSGYALKEDQRRAKPAHRLHRERRRWAPILLFTTGLIFEGAAVADTGYDASNTTAHTHQQIELRLVSSYAAHPPENELHVLVPQSQVAEPSSIRPEVANRVFEMLMRHYKKHDSDPDYLLNDLKEIANYYSGFPEVIDILNGLDNKKWDLVYDENSWVTVATGNVFQVNHASVHFNTRSAAQLKMYNRCKENPVCIASPADALLHELLHAHGMLVNTREFIAQGGMNTVLYPYKHEYAIIEAERKLYASMSRRDGVKRPQRVDHTGRLVKARCATCIK